VCNRIVIGFRVRACGFFGDFREICGNFCGVLVVFGGF